MSLEKTVENARGRWRDILIHFGVDAQFLKDEHGPCPICKGVDRFRWDNTNGNGGFYCNQCGPGSGMRLLMEHRGWIFGKASQEVDAFLPQARVEAAAAVRSEESKREAIRRLLKSAQLVTPDTPAALYLERRCGNLTGLTGDLRFHPALQHAREDPARYPALLAIMRYADLKGASVHRTYLTPDGRKAAVDPVRKIMPGFPLEGSAVRLGPLQERLGIAEGIETAICAGKLHNMPCWAAISANGILAWQPPEGVRSVVVFGDNDANFVGLAAAYEKARALRVKGFDVEVQIPPIEGQDWADVWSLAQKEQVA